MRLQQREHEIARDKRLQETTQRVAQQANDKREQARQDYAEQRTALLSRHAKQQEDLKQKWVQRKAERDHAQALIDRIRKDELPKIEKDFTRAANPQEPPAKATGSAGEQRARQAKPKPADPKRSPERTPDHIARAKEALKQRQAHDQAKERDNDKGRDR